MNIDWVFRRSTPASCGVRKVHKPEGARKDLTSSRRGGPRPRPHPHPSIHHHGALQPRWCDALECSEYLMQYSASCTNDVALCCYGFHTPGTHTVLSGSTRSLISSVKRRRGGWSRGGAAGAADVSQVLEC